MVRFSGRNFKVDTKISGVIFRMNNYTLKLDLVDGEDILEVFFGDEKILKVREGEVEFIKWLSGVNMDIGEKIKIEFPTGDFMLIKYNFHLIVSMHVKFGDSEVFYSEYDSEDEV